MSDHPIESMMNTTMEKIKTMVDASTMIGDPITAPDGTVYQHILDPKTGYPVQSDLTSVSVVTRGGFGGQGTRADAYSTALYVMGEQAAVDFWRAQDMSFDMVLITRDGRVVYTPGLADCFNEKDGTAYVYQLLAS